MKSKDAIKALAGLLTFITGILMILMIITAKESILKPESQIGEFIARFVIVILGASCAWTGWTRAREL